MRVVDDQSNDSKDPHTDLPENVKRVLQLQNDKLAGTATPAPAQQVFLNQPDGVQPPSLGTLPTTNLDKQEIRSPAQTFANRKAPAVATVADEEEETPSPSKSAVSTDEPAVKSRVSASKELGQEWKRVDFPSNCVPYLGIDDIFVRAFTVPDMEAIYDSVQTSNHTGYLDALDKCLSMDIRDLTVPDFIYLQYWLRISSYLRSPYTVDWTSRYGNEHSEALRMPLLQVMWLKMTSEEYAAWQAQGICFPTVRESEYMIESAPVNDPATGEPDLSMQPDAWIMNNAQYLMLPADAPVQNRMQQKIDLLRGHNDVDILTTIQEFALASEHGVIESIESSNKHFEPQAAITYLRQSAEQLRTLTRRIAEDNANIEQTAGLLHMIEAADSYDEEAKLIEAAVEAGETYTPRKETIALRGISSMDMFPVARKAGPAA